MIDNFNDLNVKKIFGKNLQKQRKKCGYKNQEEFAYKMEVHTKTVQNWEQGIVLPTLEKVYEICTVLECDMDFLFGRIQCTTHEIKDIQEATGLSEKAISWLKYWKSTDTFYAQEMINRLSKLICQRNFFKFIKEISDFLWLRYDENGILFTNKNKYGYNFRAEDIQNMKLLGINKLLHDMQSESRESIQQGLPDKSPSSTVSEI